MKNKVKKKAKPRQMKIALRDVLISRTNLPAPVLLISSSNSSLNCCLVYDQLEGMQYPPKETVSRPNVKYLSKLFGET